jgi:hypothetical protein
MDEIIMRVARELEIAEHVYVASFDEKNPDPLVTVVYAPHNGVQGRIRAELLMEKDLVQLKTILHEMDELAKKQC